MAVEATTVALADTGAHRGVTVSATCPAGERLVGGGTDLERAAGPAALPTNGLVLGGSTMSSGTSPVDQAAADGATDPTAWMAIANYTGVSEAGDQASTFALCATSGGPSHTVVKTATTTAANPTQEASAPAVTTATCPGGSRLIGGGATTSTPDQVNDGATAGNNGNLKPMASYPSDAAGVPAPDGAMSATSWSAYGSAGITSASDTVTAYALCSSDATTAPVRVAVAGTDGPDAQPGTTTTTANASCPSGTRLLGGGYRIDETVGTTSGLQPQQGYHMRGSYPGSATAPASDGAKNPTKWMALVQAGGQNLAAGRHMTTRAYAMCAAEPPPPDSADLSVAIADAPDPALVGGMLTYTLTVGNAGPAAAPATTLTQTLASGTSFVSASATSGVCTDAAAVVSCSIGTLASGASAVVTVVVVANVAQMLTTTASVATTANDASPSNNSATATTVASADSDPGQAGAKAVPTIAAHAAPSGAVGSPITATATLTGGSVLTGTITFRLYGASDIGCTAPIATSSAPVSGGGIYTSASYTPQASGVYRWVVDYGGDANNLAAGPTSCLDADAAVTVTGQPSATPDGRFATATAGKGKTPSNSFSIGAVKADRLGEIKLTLKSPGPGRYTIPATVKHGHTTYTFGRRVLTVRKHGTSTVTIRPGLRARTDRRKRNLRVRVAVTFRPTGGTARLRAAQVTVKRRAA